MNVLKFAIQDVHPFPHFTTTMPIYEEMKLVKVLRNYWHPNSLGEFISQWYPVMKLYIKDIRGINQFSL